MTLEFECRCEEIKVVVRVELDFYPASSVEQFRGDTLPLVKTPREDIKQVRRV